MSSPYLLLGINTEFGFPNRFKIWNPCFDEKSNLFSNSLEIICYILNNEQWTCFARVRYIPQHGSLTDVCAKYTFQ